MIEIDISQVEEYDVFMQTRKTFNEFQAFHQALSLKFKTLSFADMPPNPTFTSEAVQKVKNETFQKLLNQLIEYARDFDSL